MAGLRMRLKTPSSPLSFTVRPRYFQLPPLVHRLTHTVAAHSQAIEEQTLPSYHKKYYYPVKIGQVFNDRYRIIAKLGYGAYSTVWLARDERSYPTRIVLISAPVADLTYRANEYTSLKVSVRIDNNNAESSPVLNEIDMLQRLNQFADKDHPGLDFTRLARDMFETESFAGRHYCISYKPQGNSVRTLQEAFPNAMIPKALVKSLIHRLFFSVNWLHATCGVVHTDISPQNVLMEIDDDTILQDIEDQESQDPSLPITSTINGAMPIVVYKSRPTMLAVSGHPILTDYGQMRLVEGCVNQDWWMSDLYRAPEVLLHLPWGYAVDIWSIGVMTLELLEGKNLFDPVDRVHGQYVLPLALAQYIGYLGPPPLNIIQNSPLFSTYFDAQGQSPPFPPGQRLFSLKAITGNWISEPPIPKTSLEDFVTTIPPGEEKDQFLRFIRKILTWDPEVRATANEIIPDEWLMRPF
ncbi:protein kinase [Penicillium psychrosexuale]|uniref:protein kinase n=1 Tax=Penicillium psychrosexuale TaxID=1002107 RepID=UPI0025458A34|nr:protein kinase [Penicillium psychrosexuale]KAJ5796120.1 protein kinase [Penicillium psychrosexuale]